MIVQQDGVVWTGLYEVRLKMTYNGSYVRVSKVFQEWPPKGIATEIASLLLPRSVTSVQSCSFHGIAGD